ncbi:MAG TPA: hypothetical protein PLK35_03945 [Candidatus Moranbacteria bacterium]|nr:hypothetical protein [Candidatus Moranbacteria bacterium]
MKLEKIEKKINKILECNPSSLQWERGCFVFFVSISLLYGILIHLNARQMEKDDFYSIITYPTALERKADRLTQNYPISEMVPYIARENKKTASFMLAIAKKESNWGKFSPKKDGKECYNFWGYRGTYNQTDSGYSCFDSPEQAVNVVGERIDELIDQDLDTPRELIVWKCGSTCSGHSQAGVYKWIKDVDFYYDKIYN